MMENLFYTPRDFALIFLEEDLTVSEEYEILNQFWQERIFIDPEYKDEKELFFRDVYILKDFEIRCEKLTNMKPSRSYIDYYFKYLYWRLHYGDISFIKCKLKTLLAVFNTEKRSPKIIRDIENRLFFYHLSFYLKGKAERTLRRCELDDYIVIRQGGK